MKYIKRLSLFYIIVSFLICCAFAKEQERFKVFKAGRGYTVKVDDRVINQLFVLTESTRNGITKFGLRLQLNHGNNPAQSTQFFQGMLRRPSFRFQ